MGKAALLQKAAAAAGMDASAFSVLLDIQNGLIDAGFNEEQVAKVINDMVKNADFAGIGKSMMAVLDGHARLKVKKKIGKGDTYFSALERNYYYVFFNLLYKKCQWSSNHPKIKHNLK